MRDEAVTLEMLEGSSITADTFVESLVSPGLIESDSTPEGAVHLRFESSDAASRFAKSGIGYLETGPFTVESQQFGRVVLANRGTSALDRIVIKSVTAEAEWRLLHARELDIIPLADARRQTEFQDLDVRVVDIPAVNDIALFFNLRSDTFRDLETRKHFSQIIDPGPIARVACGSVECAVAHEPSDSLPEWNLANSITIGVPAGLPDVVLAAAGVVRQQLGARGVEVEIAHLDSSQLFEAWLDGRADIFVSPLPKVGAGRYQRLLIAVNTDVALEITGQLRARVEENDWAGAESILRNSYLAVPLFEFRNIAVISGSLCGRVAPRVDSWRWIADLRPCMENER
jgi:hypothetical protein